MRGFVVVVLCASGCVCTPLSKFCGPPNGVACPNEAYQVAEGLRVAERLWLTEGACSGPVVGTTTRGTWVVSSAPDFCGEEFYFDRSGALIGANRGCEGEGTDYGIGLRIKRGPVTRDLCVEARRRLVLRGVRLGFLAERVRGDDGGSIPHVATDGLLPLGTWTASLPGDAGELTFSAAERDGGLLISNAHLGATAWEAQLYRTWKLFPEGSFNQLSVYEWLEVPEGR